MPEANLFIFVFNVEHGNSVFVFTPNEKTIFFDCGNTQDFSPSQEVSKKGWFRAEKIGNAEYRLNKLVITHPHTDHFSDIANLRKYLLPKILMRRESLDKLDKDKLREVNNPRDENVFDEYWDFQEKYSAPAVDPDWGIEMGSYYNDCDFTSKDEPTSEQINNLSYLHIIEYGSFKMILPGDLHTAGWAKITEKYSGLKGKLQNSSILLASHHGSDNGWPEDIFEEKGKPELCIISENSIYEDGEKKKKTDISSSYSSLATGKHIINLNKTRNLLTTRDDGNIKIVVDSQGSYSVSTQFVF